MQCVVYKSLKQSDYYLYVSKDDQLQRVPGGLRQLLGRLEQVMELELSAARPLAQADVLQVIRQIEAQGYYLQMPPRRQADVPVA